MGSMGHTDPHINGISRLAASMHPAAAAAFSTGWNTTPDYRERYSMMEMQQHAHASAYNHGRPSSSFNLNVNAHGSTTTTSGGGGYQHQPQALEWQQRHASDSDHVMARQLRQHHQHQVHVHAAAENNLSMRGPGGSSASRISAMLGGGPDSMNINNTGSPASLQSCSTSSELFGNDSSNSTTVVSASGGDWQQFVDNSGVRYSSLLPPSTSSCGSPIMQQHAGGVNEGAMIRELIGRLGGSSMGPSSSNNGGPGASLVPSSPPPASTRPQQHGGGLGGVDNLMGGALKLNNGGNHGWNAANANNVSCLTVDPSKGGLSLNGGRGHCLSPFSADPGFAERAARFSSFSNNGNYAQSFSSGGDQGTGTSAAHASRMWSSSRSAAASPQQQQFSESSGSKHLSRTSSCPPLDVINSGSSTPDFLPGAAIRETHSGRGVSGHAAGAADEDENDDDNSPERTTYGRVLEGRPAAKHGDEEEERTTSTISADHATTSDPQAGRGIRGISTSSLELSAPREACPSSGNSSGGTDISAKKRKSVLDERPGPNKDAGSASASSHGDRDPKATETEDAKAKRFRRGEGCREKDDIRSKAERPSCSETSGETSPRPMKDHSKHAEPPIKPDYIHVRARRGQATDSHSLAERVRREKISERMKFLQDLVPGCSKVTGKAVMLDEIINYVQSLQRQVEFLSMKLASVNPRLDFNLESFLGKESPHPGSQATESSILYPSVHPQQQHQTQLQQQPGLDYQLHSEATLRRSLSVPVPAALPRADGFRDGVTAQTMWGDGELQSIVQMGFGNTQSMSSQALHCHIPPGQVKVELQQSPISCL